MEEIPSTNLITADGEYKIFLGPEGANVVVEVEGVFDGATVTLGRASISRVFRPYQEAGVDVVMAAGDLKVVALGIRGTLALKVLGGGGALALQFAVTRHRTQFYR